MGQVSFLCHTFSAQRGRRSRMAAPLWLSAAQGLSGTTALGRAGPLQPWEMFGTQRRTPHFPCCSVARQSTPVSSWGDMQKQDLPHSDGESGQASWDPVLQRESPSCRKPSHSLVLT